mgnify:CR=1 FL=1
MNPLNQNPSLNSQYYNMRIEVIDDNKNRLELYVLDKVNLPGMVSIPGAEIGKTALLSQDQYLCADQEGNIILVPIQAVEKILV